MALKHVVTLESLLTRFIFKEVILDKSGTAHQSSAIIRIFYDNSDGNHWFDFGLSNFSEDQNPLDAVLNSKLLKMEVESMCMDGNQLCIMLRKPQKVDKPAALADKPFDA